MKYYINVLKKYAVFKGRTSKREYWMFVLFNIIFSIVASILDAVFRTPDLRKDYGLIQPLYTLAVLIPSFAVGVRRLHDTNRTGWWVVLPFASIPLIILIRYNVTIGFILSIATFFGGTITLLIFYLLNSTPGDNKYGPNPKGEQTA